MVQCLLSIISCMNQSHRGIVLFFPLHIFLGKLMGIVFSLIHRGRAWQGGALSCDKQGESSQIFLILDN